MNNRKSTKRALLMSVLSLLLCCSMLIGTTFAWFTDEVKSGNNIITAGNLDVELYHTNRVDNNEKVTDTVKLFDDVTLWEPGAVAYETLTVKNEGTLALKYQLGINISAANFVKDSEGNLRSLAEVLQIAVVDATALTSREAAIEAGAGKWESLKSFVESGELYPEEGKNTDTYGIVIYWEPSDNDNIWNLNNGKKAEDGSDKLTITLGVSLVATQLMAENDSFGPDYDEDAIFYNKLVTTNEELKAAIEDPEAVTIAIDGDLTYDWGGDSYANSKALLMKGKTFVSYDGNDSITFAGYGSANPITDVTLKNLTVKDITVGDNEGAWEHGHLEFVGLTAENVVFANSIMLCGGENNATSMLVNCSMNNTQASWYGLWIEGGNAVIRNCSFTGTRAVKIHEAYGSEVSSVLVDDCEFILSEKPGVVIGDLNANTSVTISNSIFFTTAGDQGKYIYETDTAVDTFDFSESGNIVPEATQTSGLYKGEDGVYYATNTNGLSQGLSSMQDDETIVVCADVNFGTAQLNVEKAITIDLNGNTFTTENARPVRLTNGASLKNGTLNVTTTIAAVVVHGNEKIGSIENLTINVTTPAGKTTTGIQVYNGKYVEKISNVTITGATQGIEVAKGSRVDLIENVTVQAVGNGEKKGVALLVNAASVGKAVNCTFEGDYGVYMMLNGEFTVALELDNCTVTGSTAALIAHDEVGTSNTTNCSLTLTYDAKTTFNGAFVWNFEEECQGVVTLNAPSGN